MWQRELHYFKNGPVALAVVVVAVAAVLTGVVGVESREGTGALAHSTRRLTCFHDAASVADHPPAAVGPRPIIICRKRT